MLVIATQGHNEYSMSFSCKGRSLVQCQDILSTQCMCPLPSRTSFLIFLLLWSLRSLLSCSQAQLQQSWQRTAARGLELGRDFRGPSARVRAYPGGETLMNTLGIKTPENTCLGIKTTLEE